LRSIGDDDVLPAATNDDVDSDIAEVLLAFNDDNDDDASSMSGRIWFANTLPESVRM
jgi:tRNA(Phe) wybutosine-synthesizing methylase Tyw3